MIEEVERDPVSVGMLALKGDHLMEVSTPEYSEVLQMMQP